MIFGVGELTGNVYLIHPFEAISILQGKEKRDGNEVYCLASPLDTRR
jgi:hypothetical protein